MQLVLGHKVLCNVDSIESVATNVALDEAFYLQVTVSDTCAMYIVHVGRKKVVPQSPSTMIEAN